MTDPQRIREAIEGELLRGRGDVTFAPVSEAILAGAEDEPIGPCYLSFTRRDDGLVEIVVGSAEGGE